MFIDNSRYVGREDRRDDDGGRPHRHGGGAAAAAVRGGHADHADRRTTGWTSSPSASTATARRFWHIADANTELEANDLVEAAHL